MTAIPPIEPAPRARLAGSRRQALENWENEGGQTGAFVAALPAGVTGRNLSAPAG